MRTIDTSTLKPGDILLYDTPGDLADALIDWKTGGDAAHVETYRGGGTVWASRKEGVNVYALRPDGLLRVRRPKGEFNAANAEEQFNANLKGLAYGWGDDLQDAGVRIGTKGVNCSHCAALIQDYGGTPQFDDGFDRSRVTPRDFALPRGLETVWEH